MSGMAARQSIRDQGTSARAPEGSTDPFSLEDSAASVRASNPFSSSSQNQTMDEGNLAGDLSGIFRQSGTGGVPTLTQLQRALSSIDKRVITPLLTGPGRNQESPDGGLSSR